MYVHIQASDTTQYVYIRMYRPFFGSVYGYGSGSRLLSNTDPDPGNKKKNSKAITKFPLEFFVVVF